MQHPNLTVVRFDLYLKQYRWIHDILPWCWIQSKGGIKISRSVTGYSLHIAAVILFVHYQQRLLCSYSFHVLCELHAVFASHVPSAFPLYFHQGEAMVQSSGSLTSLEH